VDIQILKLCAHAFLFNYFSVLHLWIETKFHHTSLYHLLQFIFDAATKFCVDIATHEHGCCVLQRCIDYSTGKYQDKLIKEICRHGLILAQDPFG